ncbi:MAG: CDP-glycerol glycerophosphotransferase [Pseudonocardiales bacterium]|nr:CDP-glycerol glycerophosphotransferase [Pseudonocardiales bacterium]
MRVLHQSLQGRYSDNPRALYEQWVAGRAGDSHIWVAKPGCEAEFPVGVATVPNDGPAYVQALDEADIIIASSHIGPYDKRPEALYVQTWHGTPLKRIHRDAVQHGGKGLNGADRDIARWDLLLSPNSATTPRLRSAFGYGGVMLESGYPRNDVLSSPDAGRIRAAVRAELGVEDSTTLVLYAPTWRDDAPSPLARPDRFIGGLREGLPDNWRVMARLHYYDQALPVPDDESFVIDVSGHPDVAALYLAADVLVTDYSSVMFDFAITGKPMAFFAHDLRHYEDTLRGFYFDYRATMPGPIVDDAPDLAVALQSLVADPSPYAQRYAAFQAQFCHLEDGHAGDRVLQRLWQS